MARRKPAPYVPNTSEATRQRVLGLQAPVAQVHQHAPHEPGKELGTGRRRRRPRGEPGRHHGRQFRGVLRVTLPAAARASLPVALRNIVDEAEGQKSLAGGVSRYGVTTGGR